MSPRDEATQRQVDAAEPGQSTWLAANAGSGKTRVLTDRVARLLLDGVQPENILCLTYTKAAATEMQNRLFKRLGAWAMLNADDLRDALRVLGVERPLDEAFLAQARTLFARAIEAPGGLRIQTIHSFCSALLRRFPLEAGVSPQFTEMEDRTADLLRADLLDRMADGAHAALVAGIAPFVSGDDTAALLRDLVSHRDAFDPPKSASDIARAYDIAPGQDEDALVASVFVDTELALFADMAPVLEGSGANDQKLAAALRAVRAPNLASLVTLEKALLFQTGAKAFTAKIGSVPTKGVRTGALAPVMPRFEALMARVETARAQRLGLAAAQRDAALHGFAGVFLDLYEREKQIRGMLDFDDLIDRARRLLSDPAVAEWVLYRLDGGIDHILVDEAQDTSPKQWQVIERLAQEFTAGDGARPDVRRTIFVVGDKKQSIYSFQGADPSEFDRMRAEFADRLRATDAPLVSLDLSHSFRSAEPILRVVDNCFPDAEAAGFGADMTHRAFHEAMPGRVDLWPVVEPVKDEEDSAWYDPQDRLGSRHHTVVLANRVAQFIRHALDAKAPLPDHGDGGWHARPVRAGDFLILVRARNRLFDEIIRACKQAQLPIAGADRLKVMAELAVRDVLALLRFLATQEDDLSLATALRSPLFGLSEQDLFTLAHGRGDRTLWQVLRTQEDRFGAVLTVLRDLRDRTDFLRPYDLIARVLIRHRGRRLLVGRLGSEAEDGINALLAQALAYEQASVPSLTGFLQWAQTDDLVIKRPLDSGADQVRVMTVHGSKGLEAPIVILPDCAAPRTDLRGSVLDDPQGAIWKQSTAAQPPRQIDAVAAAKASEARERERLLYVALTRAERWLIVGAVDELGKTGTSWYEKVRAGLRASGAAPCSFSFGDWGGGEGLNLSSPTWGTLPVRDLPGTPNPAPTLPAWAETAAPPPPPLVATRSPSDLGGAKALAGPEGEDEARAMARGTAIHMLLETLSALPDPERETAGAALVESLAEHADTKPVADILPETLDEALAVLRAPHLSDLFAIGTLAEVPVSADLPGLGRVHGVIDRLIMSDDTITAVDFKSNRVVPNTPADVPEAILRQMGAYRAALQQIWPEHSIDIAIVWTRTAATMSLSHDIVTQALHRATTS